MPKVLTKGGQVACAHQGTVQLSAGQSLLKVDGQAVLVEGDLDGKSISGCTTPTSQTSQPCKTITAVIGGTATTLKADGKAVLLETVQGTTDGVPPGTWSVKSAGQTLLDAS